MNVGTYVNRKTGNSVKVVQVDEKTKTLIYEGADGKTHATSWSSFKKSYREETSETMSEKSDAENSEINKEAPKKSEKSNDNVSRETSEKVSLKDAKPKKEHKKKLDVDTMDLLEDILKKHNISYKRTKSGGGIGVFVNDVKILDIWRRSVKIRVYAAFDNPAFKKINNNLIEKMHDNPSSTAKLNKSFYVPIDNIETVICDYVKEAK